MYWFYCFREAFKKKCDICHLGLSPPPSVWQIKKPKILHFLESIFKNFWQRKKFPSPTWFVKILLKNQQNSWNFDQKQPKLHKNWVTLHFSPKNKCVLNDFKWLETDSGNISIFFFGVMNTGFYPPPSGVTFVTLFFFEGFPKMDLNILWDWPYRLPV